MDVLEPRGTVCKDRPLLGQHERAENEQGGKWDGAIVLVRGQHQIDQRFAVAAAAGGDQQEFAPNNFLEFGRNLQFDRVAPKIARIGHPLAHTLRDRKPGERIANLR